MQWRNQWASKYDGGRRHDKYEGDKYEGDRYDNKWDSHRWAGKYDGDHHEGKYSEEHHTEPTASAAPEGPSEPIKAMNYDQQGHNDDKVRGAPGVVVCSLSCAREVPIFSHLFCVHAAPSHHLVLPLPPTLTRAVAQPVGVQVRRQSP